MGTVLSVLKSAIHLSSLCADLPVIRQYYDKHHFMVGETKAPRSRNSTQKGQGLSS
jgi:hypothetical protein